MMREHAVLILVMVGIWVQFYNQLLALFERRPLPQPDVQGLQLQQPVLQRQLLQATPQLQPAPKNTPPKAKATTEQIWELANVTILSKTHLLAIMSVRILYITFSPRFPSLPSTLFARIWTPIKFLMSL